MRVVFFVLGLLALAAVAAMHFGLLALEQTRPLVVQAPQFEADVARVSIGTENKAVTVPEADVREADDGQR